jgi:hypothetical protein
LLDIDDLGSIIPVKELVLRLPPNDESVAKILASSNYAAIFTADNDEESDVIIMANGITEEELNNEKRKTIDKANKKSRVSVFAAAFVKNVLLAAALRHCCSI